MQEGWEPTELAVHAEGDRRAGKQLLVDTVHNLAAVHIPAVVLAVVHTDKAAVGQKKVDHMEVGRWHMIVAGMAVVAGMVPHPPWARSTTSQSDVLTC
jgi:hypothetical protein